MQSVNIIMFNKKYGDLATNGKGIKYAPRVFKEDNVIFVPREDDDEAYFARGWLKVIDKKPSYDPETEFIAFQRWEKDVDAKTITTKYAVEKIPDDKKTKATRYSKLKITLFCMENDLWNDVKKFLDRAGYYDLFVMAQYFLSTDDYFQRGIAAFKRHYIEQGHDEEQLNALIEQMKMFAEDGFEIVEVDAETAQDLTDVSEDNSLSSSVLSVETS